MRTVNITFKMKNSAPLVNLRELMAVVAFASSIAVATAQTVVPDGSNSAKYGCPLSPAEFKSWFVSGLVTANGRTNPPNNISFSGKEDCSFYQTAEQMFLWVTSPPLVGYGGGSYVFDSPVFYEVSPSGGGQPSALVAKGFERSKIATVSVAQRGPDGSEVVFDDAGKMYGIVDAGSNPFIETRDRKIEIDSIGTGTDGMPAFLDKSGETISLPLGQTPTLRDTEGMTIVFKTPPVPINSHGQLFFLDQSGKVIAVGSGQANAGRHVLMMQDNNLVYYLVHVNDVYAYFLTGAKHGKIMPVPTMFPTSQSDLNAVKTYAKKSFPDEKVLWCDGSEDHDDPRKLGEFMKSRAGDRSDAMEANAPREARGRLFRKYVALFVAVISVALIANGLFQIWFDYNAGENPARSGFSANRPKQRR